jgi:hypothetical protein
MKSGFFWAACLSLFGLAVVPSLGLADEAADKTAARKRMEDVKKLAARIDYHIVAGWKAKKAKPAPQSDDGEFFRRISLDLTGRIPSLTDIRDFIDDDRPDKRWLWVEDLLEKQAEPSKDTYYARHFANVWRHILLPQTNNEQVQFLAGGMESWLRQRFQENTGYNKMVRELLTAPVFGQNNNASPSVFYQANEFKAENLAANTSRLFLGHKLECAQCHDHPFAKWTRKQFWEYTAFFAGINQGRGEDTRVREVKIPGKNKMVQARFLDGTQPKWQEGVSTRTVLADWLTRADNPYFAKATVNKVWAYFFAIGLIEPVDEPSDDNLPSHPELLDELAKEFAAHDFDLKFLIRAIIASRTYQLSSALSDKSQKDPRLFARMAVRGLSPEQLFDSVSEAIGYKDYGSTDNNRGFNQFGVNTPRALFLSKFATSAKRGETETSILQALFMMNSDFMAKATRLDGNDTLKYIANSSIKPAKRIEQLYLITLSRVPRAEESARLIKYVEKGGKTGDSKKAFEDILWALLNSAEFMMIR